MKPPLSQTPLRPGFEAGGRGMGREEGRFVLRSGVRLHLKRALAEDAERIEAFIARLPEVDRMDLLKSLYIEVGGIGDFLKTQEAKTSGTSLLVEDEDGEQVVAFASYQLMPGLKDAAWVGMAVARKWRREGVASLLLGRISVLAARHGVLRMVGVSDAENHALLALLKASGFEPDIREGDNLTRFLISTKPDPGEDVESGVPAAKTFVTASLRPLFEPSSVAVIGASRKPESLGHRIVKSIIDGGFQGPVFPINPAAGHIRSIRASPSITALKNEIDLAIIVVPAGNIPEIVDQCADAGVKALIVISAYYSEVGPEGRERELRLAEQVRRRGMRMLGPNCMGLIQTKKGIRLNASFAERMPSAGCAALCSQSGALGVAITSLAQRLGLGVSTMVNVGNRVDITVNDLLEYWEEDEQTRVILFYLESFGDPRRFARVARRVGRTRPIVVVKGGHSRAGRRVAAESVSLFDASNMAVEALLKQTGVIRAENLDEMFDIARALTQQPLPAGPRVAIMTNAGGAGILAADALEKAGLEIVELAEETQAALEKILPPEAQLRNPVDMLAASDAGRYEALSSLLLKAEEVDALVVLFTPLGLADTGDVMQGLTRGLSEARDSGFGELKPVLVSIVGEDQRRSIGGGPLREEFPVYGFPETVGRVLGKILCYSSWRSRETGAFPEFPGQQLPRLREMCRDISSHRESGILSDQETSDFLLLAELPPLEGLSAETAAEAVSHAGTLGYPVVLRLRCAELEERMEKGAIRLDLRSSDEVRKSFREMDEFLSDRSSGDGVIVVQKAIVDAGELRLRVRDDSRFGPLISLGMGGIYLEALKDVVFRVSPLTDLDARGMIRELQGVKLLEGYRGHPPADLEALEALLLRLSRVVEAIPQLEEIQIEPLMVLQPGRGCRILDARVRLRPTGIY